MILDVRSANRPRIQPEMTKAELIKYLKDSFDYSNHVLATLTVKNALDRIEGRYAGPNTKLGISVVAVCTSRITTDSLSSTCA